jgi:2-polyprenyl-6-methoxyphenol hydroxylase-like FAD-dependent oxidoreductase
VRVLIAGAGVAVLALAGLLRRQGHHPVVVERRAADDEPGYAVALWPHGTRVLRIGASMALESAAALADELSRSDAEHAHQALLLYERRRRRRVERAQAQSRRLARLMFVRSARVAHLRDRALRLTSVEQLLGGLVRDLRRPI